MTELLDNEELLHEDAAIKAAPAHWVVSGSRDLPLGDDVPWDGAGAKARLYDLAGFNGDNPTPHPDKIKGAFLLFNPNDKNLKQGYAYPFAAPKNGKLTAMPAGIRAAKSRMAQSDLSADVKARAIAIADYYLGKMHAASSNVSASSGKALSDTLCYPGGAIKSVGTKRSGGMLVSFTNPQKKDLTHEYFDANTNFMLGVYPIKGINTLFQHGMDNSVGSIPLGKVVEVSVGSKGIYVEQSWDFFANYKAYATALKRPQSWLNEQLDYAREYEKMLEEMERNGELNWSSGAHPPSVRKSADGHIDQWAIWEATNTPTPAMPYDTKIMPVKSLVFNPLDARLPATVLTGHEDGKEARNGTEERSRSVWNVQAPIHSSPNEEDNFMLYNEDILRGQVDAFAEQVVNQLAQDKNAPHPDLKSFSRDLMSAVKAKAKDMPEPDEPDGDEADEEDDEDMPEGEGKKAEKMLDLIINTAQTLTNDLMARQSVRKDAAKSIVSGALEYAKEYRRPGKSKVGGFSEDNGSGGNGDGSVKNVNFNKLNQSKYKPGLLSAIKAQMPQTFGSEEAANYRDSGAIKALSPYAGAVGGYLLNNELREDILPPLRASVIAFKLGVKQTMMEGTGSLTIAKMTVAPTAYRPGINTAITDSTPTFQTLTAFPKPITSEVIIPRQQLLAGSASVEEDIRQQMILSIQLQIDQEIFIGTGNVTSPDTSAGIRGILQTAAAANQVTLAPDGRQPQFADLIAAQTQIRKQNVPFDASMGYALNPVQLGSLYSQTDTTGQPLMRMNNSTGNYDNLVGYPQQWSTQIPTNVTAGANTDTSYIFFGRWDMGEYFMLNDVAILVDEVTLMNLLQVRLIAYTFSDFLIHYPEAFYVMKGVRA